VSVEVVLAIGGPALTTAGAALLAYDVLRGPARTLRDVHLATRLEVADEHREANSQSLVDAGDAGIERSTGEHSADLARIDADHAHAVHRAESLHADADAVDRARAFRLGIWGLCLVTVGGAAETIAAIIAATRSGR
jgi:hypothetical protein